MGYLEDQVAWSSAATIIFHTAESSCEFVEVACTRNSLVERVEGEEEESRVALVIQLVIEGFSSSWVDMDSCKFPSFGKCKLCEMVNKLRTS